MSEKEILDKIEKSAAQEKVPESIEPEQIKRKLKENQKNKVKRRSGITYYGAVAAAALVLVIGAAGGIHAVTGGGTGLMTAPVGIEKAASGQKSDEGSEGSSELKDGATAGVEKNAQKKDAGSLYTVAKNYGEVYDAICSGSGQEKEADGIAVAEGDSSNSGDAATYIMDDTSDTVDAAVDGVEEIGGTQMIKGAGAQEGQTAADISSDTAKQRYSGTNLQKEGVPEDEWYVSEYDGKKKKTLGKKNADFQIKKFDSNAQPNYILLDSRGGNDADLKQHVLAPARGHNLDKDAFVNFLKQGIEEYKKRNK